MERGKRKGLVEEEKKDGKKKKRNEKKKEEDPTDEEVDEFYRILKRMHVAMEYFGVKSKLLSSQRWISEAMGDAQQGLEKEEEDDDDQGEREKFLEKKIKSGHGILDLNADPK